MRKSLIPTISESEILVKVCACAVNHLDIRARRDRPEVQPFPHVLGSDISGEVVEAGAKVQNVNVGDRVVLSPCIPCGECVDCLQRRRESVRLTDSFRVPNQRWDTPQYVKVPAENAIVTLPTAFLP